jgi:hypothetical protein
MPPGWAADRTSNLYRKPNWWHATIEAREIRYGARIGRDPNLRCDTVTAPDFFES